MKQPKLKILIYQNYLQIIRASQGSKMFRHLYVLMDEQKKDILENGQLSCAFFVSTVLKIFDLISRPHATVKNTVEDMLKNGWRPTEKLKPGNVLVWEEKEFSDGTANQHIGFYFGQNKAVSNSYKKSVPALHHFTFVQTKTGQPKRKIIQILTHRLIKEK